MIAFFAAAVLAAQAQPAPPAEAMDCSVGFQPLVEDVSEREGVRVVGPSEQNPFVSLLDQANETIYFVTAEEDAPAFPAVVRLIMRDDEGGVRATPSGCTYGDQAEVEALMGLIGETLERVLAAGRPTDGQAQQ